MYEEQTYEAIMNRCLARVPGTLDKREGSIIYDALAPMAAELAQLYVALSGLQDESFADTAGRDNLVRRAAERGMRPEPATAAVLRGTFDAPVAIGARFALGDYTYRVTEQISTGSYRLVCETAGAACNAALGDLIPIDYVAGLTSAKLAELLIPGEDEEETETFRARYFDSLNNLAYGGNVADYKNKVSALAGVGGVRVTPAWNGPGTVKLVVIDSTHGAPSDTLINTVQTAVDPTANAGQGAGIAPIGHTVTVAGVQKAVIYIAATVTLQSGWNWAAVRPYAESAVDTYFSELAAVWSSSAPLVVRISQIESRLLDVPGVVDIAGTTINGAAANLVLGENEIPVRGSLNG